MAVVLDTRGVLDFVTESELELLEPQAKLAAKLLAREQLKVGNMVGWHNLPTDCDPALLEEINQVADQIKNLAELFIVIGIGGSYLGARAAIELLKTRFHNKKGGVQIYFAGTNMSASHLNNLLELCKDKDVCINVISKSGNTLEPALTFRAFKKLLEAKYGETGAKKRIFVTTSNSHSSRLFELADALGYKKFAIPQDIGGRFSVLTPVGLLPMAVAGVNINQVILGSKLAHEDLQGNTLENQSMLYAVYRSCLLRKGRKLELIAGFEPDFEYLFRWWQQLFAESEGKSGRGIFPMPAIYSMDLHSIGQFVQESGQNLFETFVEVKTTTNEHVIEMAKEDYDGLNFLAGKSLSFVNQMAQKGTIAAHVEGGVPCLVLQLPEVNEPEYGYLVYFLEKACALSCYLLGVNPFNQPGVEAYKTKMLKLLKGEKY